MRNSKLFKGVAMAVVLSSLVYTNLVFWHSAFFGWLILLTVCLYTGAEAHNFLNKFFNLSKSLRIRVLAIFLVLLIWGSVAGMLALIFKMSSFVLTVSVLITILGFDWLNLLVGERIEIIPEIDDENKKVLEEFPAAKLGVLLYIILILAGFYFLANSQTSAAILTPWQVIPTHYIWIFFAATLVLGLLIFSKLKSGVLLFLLILHSLLLHAYLPLTHVLFYGADGWRHLALESSWWTQGTLMSPTLSSVPVSIWQRFDFGSLAYAQFSSLALIFQKLCQVDPLSFMRNFMPIVWSVVLPILLFEIARTFAWEKRAALFLVWLAALSFALQASGSFSLPVNLGMLFWVFALLLQIKNRTNFSKAGLIFLFGLGVLFLFGHALFFILFWLGFGLLWLIKSKTSEIKLFFVAIFTAAVIPVLELISHYSDFNPQINWWTQIKFLVGNFVVWYLAVGNYTHDISAGNIFFNQPSLNALIVNFFTFNRWWLVFFMAAFWIVRLVAIWKMLETREQLHNFWITLTLALVSSYVVSRYFLSGENILARRMDAVLAILILVPVVWWIYGFIIKQKDFFKQRIIIFLVMTIFSAAISASYTLGPDTRAVSGDEYSAMQYVWNKEKNNGKICVLSDTFPLLALEAVSNRKVVGGGFPINSFFAQPERIQYLQTANSDPRLALSESKQLLKTNDCYLVGDYNMQGEEAKFGNISVFKD